MANIQSSKLSGKYQTVIPAGIRKLLNLEAGDRIVWEIAYIGNKPKAIAEPEPDSWAKYGRGLGKQIWEKVDIDKYIENLRKEWQAQN